MPASMPKTPMFVIEIVPPREVGGLRSCRRAPSSASSAIASASSRRVIALGVLDVRHRRARARSRRRCRGSRSRTARSPARSSSQRALSLGCAARARCSTRLRDDGERRDACGRRTRGRRGAARAAPSSAVTSTVRNSVTCGAVNALRTIAAAVCLRTPVIGMRVSRGGCCRRPTSAAARRRAGTRRPTPCGPGHARTSTSDAAASTSSRVMSPRSPVPVDRLEVDAEVAGELAHRRRRTRSLGARFDLGDGWHRRRDVRRRGLDGRRRPPATSAARHARAASGRSRRRRRSRRGSARVRRRPRRLPAWCSAAWTAVRRRRLMRRPRRRLGRGRASELGDRLARVAGESGAPTSIVSPSAGVQRGDDARVRRRAARRRPWRSRPRR